ncbi:hypothetical protein [Roseovarius sp. EL26]|uniref:hypothetical protein n=1 Tax=Roseovarius sp. EL26 TaxID=2126672 RepID=UPI000EA3DE5A|nr:hypothetical protein [Roseovarius sp. EL26]
MSPRIFILTSVMILASCAPPNIFYKQGSTAISTDRDRGACEQQAMRDVPPQIHTRYIPPVYSYRPVCNGTHCYNRQILVSPGRWEQYDAAASLRAKAVDQCMASNGYSQISLPRCEEDITRGRKIPINTPMPTITEQSCAVKAKSGQWRIITP